MRNNKFLIDMIRIHLKSAKGLIDGSELGHEFHTSIRVEKDLVEIEKITDDLERRAERLMHDCFGLK